MDDVEEFINEIRGIPSENGDDQDGKKSIWNYFENFVGLFTKLVESEMNKKIPENLKEFLNEIEDDESVKPPGIKNEKKSAIDENTYYVDDVEEFTNELRGIPSGGDDQDEKKSVKKPGINKNEKKSANKTSFSGDDEDFEEYLKEVRQIQAENGDLTKILYIFKLDFVGMITFYFSLYNF